MTLELALLNWPVKKHIARAVFATRRQYCVDGFPPCPSQWRSRGFPSLGAFDEVATVKNVRVWGPLCVWPASRQMHDERRTAGRPKESMQHDITGSTCGAGTVSWNAHRPPGSCSNSSSFYTFLLSSASSIPTESLTFGLCASIKIKMEKVRTQI